MRIPSPETTTRRPATLSRPGELSPPPSSPRTLLVARLVRPQGRHGEILSDILTDFPERFSDRRRLLLLPPQGPAGPRPCVLERHWLHKGRVVLKIEGVDSIDDAERLRGWGLGIPVEERTPVDPDTFYIADLVGCSVVDEGAGGAPLGEIEDVQRGQSGAADLLVVRPAAGPGAGGAEALLIPFARAYLVGLDVAARRLCLRLPQGLAEMNLTLRAAARSPNMETEPGPEPEAEPEADPERGLDDAL